MEMSSGLVGSITVIVLAYAGQGVWALMLGWLVNNVVRLMGFVIIAGKYYGCRALGSPASGRFCHTACFEFSTI